MNTRFSKIKSFLFFLDASSIKGFIITPEGVECLFFEWRKLCCKGRKQAGIVLWKQICHSVQSLQKVR